MRHGRNKICGPIQAKGPLSQAQEGLLHVRWREGMGRGEGGQGLRGVFSVKSKRIASLLQRSRANLSIVKSYLALHKFPPIPIRVGPAQWPPATAPPNLSTCGHAMRGRGQARQVRPKSSPDLFGGPFHDSEGQRFGYYYDWGTSDGGQLDIYMLYSIRSLYSISYRCEWKQLQANSKTLFVRPGIRLLARPNFSLKNRQGRSEGHLLVHHLYIY